MINDKLLQQRFLLEDAEMMNLYDKENFMNNLQFYKEGVENMVSVVLTATGDTNVDMITQTMDHMRNLAGDYKELVDFFEGIYKSTRLNSIPITTELYNLGTIEKIRPQYLSQLSTDIGLVIDKYLKRSISRREIENIYMTDQYLINCKKQMVRTSLPYDLSPKDLAKMDQAVLCEINTEFISSNILPFLRNVPQMVKDLEITSSNTISVIEKSYDELKTYASVIDKLFREGKISQDDYRFMNKFLYKSIRTFNSAASYLTFVMIRKIGVVSQTIAAYSELRVKILNYFPEGDLLLHESVLDGSLNDLDMNALVHDVLINNSSMFRSAIRSIVGRERSNIAFAIGPSANDDDHSMIDINMEDYPYKVDVYHNAKASVNAINTGLESIRENAKDPMIPFDDIIKKAGFDVHPTDRFAGIINAIPELKDYDFLMNANISDAERKDVYLMALHELQDMDKMIDEISYEIYITYSNYNELKTEAETGDPLQFRNPETLKELNRFLDEFDADFRQFVLNLLTAFVNRIKNLDNTVSSIEGQMIHNEDISGGCVEDSDEDFMDLATESMLAIESVITDATFESLLKDYNKIRTFYETGMKVVYLEDGEGNTTGNTGNANNANGNGSFKSIIDGIIKMIDDFFNKSKTMLGDLMKKQTNYGTWIHDEKVRDGILNRNYSPVVFNVLPYEKHVTTDAMLNDIASLQANITGLNAGNIRKYNTKKNLNGYLFKFMTNNLGSVEDIGETMKSYYKTKEAKLEVMSYSGAQAKDLAKTMIDYSSLFYGENGNGFSSQLMDKLDAVNKALNSKLQELETMNVNESVLYEADENTGTTQTNAQPASGTNTQSSGTNNTTNSGTGDKKSTKATVQIDKATDSNVSEDGKKSETDTIISILKWLSSSVQTYCAGTLNAARDRNWDYIKILDGVAPEQVKFKKWCADNNLGDQNTNNQNAQNNQNNTQNTEQNNQNNNNQQAS